MSDTELPTRDQAVVIVAVCDEAIKLLERGWWTGRGYAADGHSNACDPVCDPAAASWSMEGALMKACDDACTQMRLPFGSLGWTYRWILRDMERRTRSVGMSVFHYNRAEGTSKSNVQGIFACIARDLKEKVLK